MLNDLRLIVNFVLLIFVELIDNRCLQFIFIANSIVPTIYCRGLGATNADRQKIYIKPYCRMGPYLVGMYTGYLLYKFNGKFRMNKVTTYYLCLDIGILHRPPRGRRGHGSWIYNYLCNWCLSSRKL